MRAALRATSLPCQAARFSTDSVTSTAAASSAPAALPKAAAARLVATSSEARKSKARGYRNSGAQELVKRTAPVSEPKTRMVNFYNARNPITRFFDRASDRYAGRAWFADELRQKSFDDLQKLHMVLMMERNKLLSEKYRARVSGQEALYGKHRPKRVRQSIARLLTVVNERSRERAATRKALLHDNLAEKIASASAKPAVAATTASSSSAVHP